MAFNPTQFSYPTIPGHGSVDPEIQQWFNAVDVDKSGKINAKELQSALVNGQNKNFNMPVCELLISMFNKDHTGMINIEEFQHLFKFVNQWLTTFRSFDKDQSGAIEEEEVSQAFQQMGYRFSDTFIKFLIERADKKEKKKISVDQFILVCIQIQRFTDAFRSRDTEMKGIITVSFEDFLTVGLSCSS